MFQAAARALADQVTEDDLNMGRVYPPLAQIRNVSAQIATAVARTAQDQGLANVHLPENDADLLADIYNTMYQPLR